MAGKKKETLAEGYCRLKYTGRCASYTLHTTRFSPGEIHSVAAEYAQAAIASGQFEVMQDEVYGE